MFLGKKDYLFLNPAHLQLGMLQLKKRKKETASFSCPGHSKPVTWVENLIETLPTGLIIAFLNLHRNTVSQSFHITY